MSSKETENKSEVEPPDKSLLYGYRDKYWMPGYSHHSWNGRLDYQHKTRRKGELLTLSYMLALTRQRTEQENSCSLQRSFLSEDRLTVRISANDLFRKYRHYTDCTTQGDILGYSDSANRASMINFSISYRFGKLKASVKKTETTIDNSDVVGGITKGNRLHAEDSVKESHFISFQ